MVVSDPELEMDCALEPLRVTVAALAGLKLRVPPDSTAILPFKLKVPVTARFQVTPDPTVRPPLIVSVLDWLVVRLQDPDVLSRLKLP